MKTSMSVFRGFEVLDKYYTGYSTSKQIMKHKVELERFKDLSLEEKLGSKINDLLLPTCVLTILDSIGVYLYLDLYTINFEVNEYNYHRLKTKKMALGILKAHLEAIGLGFDIDEIDDEMIKRIRNKYNDMYLSLKILENFGFEIIKSCRYNEYVNAGYNTNLYNSVAAVLLSYPILLEFVDLKERQGKNDSIFPELVVKNTDVDTFTTLCRIMDVNFKVWYGSRGNRKYPHNTYFDVFLPKRLKNDI